jgi:Sulfotransferase family
LERKCWSPTHADVVPVDMFLHIPKTAGTTLVRILHRQYAKTGYVWIKAGTSFENAKLQVVREGEERFRLVHGHVPFGIHDAITRPVRYFTLVRDPIDRVLSHYYFARSHPAHRLYRDITEKGMTLRDYVMSGMTGELANGQTALLAGQEHDAPTGDLSLLDRARANVTRHFSAVGVTEDFERTIVLFKLALGWRRPLVYESVNVTAGRPDANAIDEETLETIRSLNRLDEVLYHFVRERFESAVAEREGAVRRELRLLRLGNFLYRRTPLVRQSRNMLRRFRAASVGRSYPES